MTPNPNYRMRITFYDDTSDEVVCEVNEPMMSQNSVADHIENDNLPIYHRAMRGFHSERPSFEEIHYPKNEE